MLSHDNLINYFKVNFALMQFHKYSLTELENMIPWEKMIYMDLLRSHIKEEEQKAADMKAAQRTKK
jgi:hypothetical protein